MTVSQIIVSIEAASRVWEASDKGQLAAEVYSERLQYFGEQLLTASGRIKRGER